MSQLTHHDSVMFLISLALLLGLARLLGEVAKRIHQPAVIGELLAGIILGPTVFGRMIPMWQHELFPHEGAVAVARNSLVTLAVVLFLLVAGMEVDLSTAWRSGKTALFVSFCGLSLSFATGFTIAWYFPGLLQIPAGVKPFVFALFFATALCITALPVVSKILFDLNIFRTDIGIVVVAAAVVDDLTGWLIFALVLSMMGNSGAAEFSVGYTILLTLLFAGGMLTLGRWIVHRTLPWLQAHLSWPGGVMGTTLTVALLCAAFTEFIGIHAIFGAFIFGVALGDTRHLRERTRATLDQFISFIFAPLFIASIGLHVDFVSSFDPLLTLTVLCLATVCKVTGCTTGALLSGMPRRESFAIGFGMNARGAMEIILGLLALQAGVIGEPLFVALVIMALVTSVISGTAVQKILRLSKISHFADLLNPKAYVANSLIRDRRAAIAEMSQLLAAEGGPTAEEITNAVWDREMLMPTGLANQVAVPHARLESIKAPVIAVGTFPEGVDFDATDGQPANLIFLILTPKNDNGAQLEILASIARAAIDPRLADEAAEAANFTELLAVLKARALAH
ncbi:hypothetical protein BH09SUM1_BH09SUM1_32990 [soil metagenome]